MTIQRLVMPQRCSHRRYGLAAGLPFTGRLIAAMLLLPLVLGLRVAAGQGSRADYERAAIIGERFRQAWRAGGGGEDVRPEWLGPSRFWYSEADPSDLAAGRRHWLVDAALGTRRPLVDPEALARGIASTAGGEGTAVAPGQVVIERVIEDEDDLLLLVRGVDWPLRVGGADGRVQVEMVEGEAAAATGRGMTAAPAQLCLRPLQAPPPSRGGGRETSIRFVNRTAGPVRLLWIDPQGGRREYVRLDPGRIHAQHTFAGHVWVAVADDGRELACFSADEHATIAEVREEGPSPSSGDEPSPPAGAIPSPTRAPQAIVREHNLWIETGEGEPVAITTDGVEGAGYSRPLLSPDGTRVLAIRSKSVPVRRIRLIESSPSDQVEPRLHELEYPKPGDPLPQQEPCLFDVAGRREIPVDAGPFEDAWSIDALRWEPDSSRATMIFNPRGHRGQRILAIDAASGQVSVLVDEPCQTFFDYASKRFLHFTEGGEIIWMSERDGWNHLYLLDARTGDLRNRITTGDWVVRGVERVDEANRQIWFRAGGIRPDQDPYHVHWARVNFDGSGLVVLTEGDGTHEVDFSPDRSWFIDRWSRADQPPVTELRRSADGGLVLRLGQVDIAPLVEAGWRPPQRFVAKGRDGVTDIHGLIHRPSTWVPGERCPVIEAIYAGPHGAHVPKSFRPAPDVLQLTELGFIVVQIDGMGTNFRSKAFHDVAWRNLRDAGLPDRIAWLRAAAQAHPELDLGNDGRGVGIYGGSAGGQNAVAALLWHGDFYKAAAADCGCHDNRMDKIWWNELWMSWPIGPWYEESSNVVNAHRLPADCALLLTVGELDRNVDPASTMQLAAALQRADRDFQLVVLPGAGHGAGESPYGRRRRQDFFVRTLMGREPRWEEAPTNERESGTSGG